MMTKTATPKTLIRFTAVNRRTRTSRPCWVSGARFSDGDGFAVKSISWTMDREKAARFLTSTAHAIAVQFCNTPAFLELVDGTPLVAETEILLAEQKARYDANRATAAQFRADLEEAFSGLRGEMMEAVYRALL